MMKVLKFEGKESFKRVLIWAIGLIGLCYFIYDLVFRAFLDSKGSFENLITAFPKEFLKVFDFDITSLLSIEGYLQFGFTYLSLFGAIFASGLALQVFAREKREGALEFLFTKPMKRSRLYLEKYLACFLLVLVMGVIHGGIITYVYATQQDKALSICMFCYLFVPFLLNELLFLQFGILYSLYVKKIRNVSGVAVTFGILGFSLSALVNLMDKEALLILAPLKYFEWVVKEGNVKGLSFMGIPGVGLLLILFVLSLNHNKNTEVYND